MAVNALGRPSGLTPELIEKAKEYLVGGYEDVGNIVPSIAGLGCYLGISRSSIYEYKATNSDLGRSFMDTLEDILMKQEMLLINGGLGQTFSGTITKLMLANHGYSDSVKQDVTTNGESISAPVINVGKLSDEQLRSFDALISQASEAGAIET